MRRAALLLVPVLAELRRSHPEVRVVLAGAIEGAVLEHRHHLLLACHPQHLFQ